MNKVVTKKIKKVSPNKLGNLLKKMIVLPINEFIKFQELGGIILLTFTALALILANSGVGHEFAEFWETHIHVTVGPQGFEVSLLHLINDGLMTIFFIVVGLEIKREIIEGELSKRSKAILPVIAALGGMVAPALVFILFNITSPDSYQKGWGIPMATDIAFSLTIISLLGSRVPAGLKIFLAALAIVDDLGAILVIALFYSSNVGWLALLMALLSFGAMIALNAMRVTKIFPYALLGMIVWVGLLQAGIHPTIAGVLFAISIPHRSKQQVNEEEIITTLEGHLNSLKSEQCKNDKMFRDQVLEELQRVSSIIESPLQNLLHQLHPISSYFIMPLFAFANAGVIFDTGSLQEVWSNNLFWGIVGGLILGKSLGITLATWTSVKAGLAQFPSEVNSWGIYGVAWLAGIGFTMSIFIANLALSPAEVEIAKIAILGASLISGIVGYVILGKTFKKPSLQ